MHTRYSFKTSLLTIGQCCWKTSWSPKSWGMGVRMMANTETPQERCMSLYCSFLISGLSWEKNDESIRFAERVWVKENEFRRTLADFSAIILPDAMCLNSHLHQHIPVTLAGGNPREEGSEGCSKIFTVYEGLWGRGGKWFICGISEHTQPVLT